MKLIVVTDIFGYTAALPELTSQFSHLYAEICVIDPYSGREPSFEHEEEAYLYFQQHCGLVRLTERLREEIDRSVAQVDLLGFSVGAAAAWDISAGGRVEKVRKVVCFYGSRIREKTDLHPRVPVTLIFPSHEKGFELESVIQALERRKNVEIIRTSYRHGFMNKKSLNYADDAYHDFCQWLKTTLRASPQEKEK